MARGLAAIVCFWGLDALADAIPYLFSPDRMIYGTVYFVVSLGKPIVYFSVAALLWMKAGHFGPPDETPGGAPIDSRTGVALALAAVGLYIITTRVHDVLEFLWNSLDKRDTTYLSPYPTNWGGVISAGLATALLLGAWRQFLILRPPATEEGE